MEVLWSLIVGIWGIIDILHSALHPNATYSEPQKVYTWIQDDLWEDSLFFSLKGHVSGFNYTYILNLKSESLKHQDPQI